MTGWVLLGMYCLGYLAVWRTLVWWLMDVKPGEHVDGDDVVYGVFMGSLAALVWPLIWAIRGIRAFYLWRQQDAARFLMPRSVRREADLTAREARIKQLERELNIR